MKKFLALTLALLMVFSLAACGGGGDAETTTPPPAATTAPPVTEPPVEENTPPAAAPAEAIDYTPLIHLDFETTDGLKATTQIIDTTTSKPVGICDSNHPITLAEGQGAVGNALYLDGKYGVDFDMVEINDDSYTISFWYNADRVATFGPVLQMGRNVGGGIADVPTTWINVTKTTWGAGDADIFPVVWNRNSSIGTEVAADGVWPWIYAMDDQQHGKKEWCLLTIVVDGNRYVADDGMERVATKFYLNGVQMWDANAENMYYQGLSPEIFAGGNLEAHIGINYWDTMYKGFIDELYVYDEPLTAGQVTTLFEQGNPPATPTAPETPDYVESEEATTSSDPVVDEPGSLTIGAFFSAKTDFTALADGQTLTYTFRNTSSGSNNWENFVMAVVTADAAGYTGAENEVVIIRADAWGWGGGASDIVAPDGEGNKLAFETNANFDEWQGKMKDGVDVSLTIAHNGNTLTYNATIGEYTVSTTVTSGVDLPETLYVFFTGENCKLSNMAVS